MGRSKLSEDRKKKTLSTSVNTELIGLYEQYLTENNITHKSKFIEKELKELLKNKEKLNYLIEEGILPDKNKLLNKKDI